MIAASFSLCLVLSCKSLGDKSVNSTTQNEPPSIETSNTSEPMADEDALQAEDKFFDDSTERYSGNDSEVIQPNDEEAPSIYEQYPDNSTEEPSDDLEDEE